MFILWVLRKLIQKIQTTDLLNPESLMYLGYVIGGGELKTDSSKMEAIMKWLVPTNVSEVESFIGPAQYQRKFIASFSAVAAPLHAITTSGKSLQWGKCQQRAFEELYGRSSKHQF